mgnify:CR=1 FL=1
MSWVSFFQVLQRTGHCGVLEGLLILLQHHHSPRAVAVKPVTLVDNGPYLAAAQQLLQASTGVGQPIFSLYQARSRKSGSTALASR